MAKGASSETTVQSRDQQQVGARGRGLIICVSVLLSTLSVLVLIYRFYRSETNLLHPLSAELNPPQVLPSDAKEPKHKHPCPLPTARYDILTDQTACYPSTGGIWMTELGPLELQHLCINRFESTERSSNQEDEDAFCRELRVFGGSWYNPAPDGSDLFVGGECYPLHEFEPVFSIVRRVGFPRVEDGGGVWVLGVDGETGRFPEGMATVRNALTMQEQCMALERLGAVFCGDVSSCRALED